MTKREDWLTKENVQFVECLVPDFNGVGKGKVVPTEAFKAGDIRLPEAIFGQDVVGDWCEDHKLLDVADVDMVLVPDHTTLARQPWSGRRLAQCICDCETPEGDEIDVAPRGLLKRIIERFHSMGLEPIVAEEAEFYLVERNPDPLVPLKVAPGISGRQQSSPRSFQAEAMAEFSPYLDRLCEYAEAQNIETAGMVQEMGQGQLEINFNHGPALAKADEMFSFKRLARQAAMDEGYYATFLAQPISNAPGSAMHLHQSLVDQQTGENRFVADDGGCSEMFYSYLAGLQKYTPYVMAILAPNVNSYRRFEGAESCPTNVEWGVDNRTTGFRVPKASGAATRIENRIPGSDTNPYLAVAVSLACGYLGIKQGLRPGKPVQGNAWDLDYTLSRTLRESIELMQQESALVELLGERFVKLYVDVKRREVDASARIVTAWEREHLLLTV